MKEFFLNHICTTPPFSVAACEYQYNWLVPIGIGILVLMVIALLASIWEFWIKGAPA